MIGEKIYEYDLDITGVADFGVSLQAIAAGEVTVPPQGARFDIAFDGRGKGRISGECAGSITSDCAPMAASISTSEQPSRQATATGSRCLPVAWGCRARGSR
jgi:hypothetical protein